MKRKPVIAIDGYSSTGKSSISKIIAEKLGIIHLDTGALYRAVTLFAMEHCSTYGNEIDLTKLLKSLHHINLEFKLENGHLVLYMNGKDVSKSIRTQKVSSHVSFIAKQPEIREFLLETQRNMAKNGGIIVDGRDIGTVVLPNADYKFFMTASTDVRTKRRYDELKSYGHDVKPDEVRKNLLHRDKIDSERTVAPLKQAEDAIIIDNSELTKDETVALILSFIKDN